MSELLLVSVFVFALALMVGVEIIQKVPQTLHTPLMSGSNAISGITIVGAIALATLGGSSGEGELPGWARAAGLAAIVFAMINVVGGFLVTDRMLKMFKRK